MIRLTPAFPAVPLLAILALTVAFTPSVSEALPCTVDVAHNPDPFVSSSTLCGAGNTKNNDGRSNSGAVLLGNVLGGTWIKIDTDAQGSPNPDLGFYFTGSSSGNFYIDTGIVAFNQLVLVMKGASNLPNPNPPYNDIGWVWFLLDGTSSIACPEGYEICGTWSMWGNPTSPDPYDLKTVSHLTLYGQNTGGGINLPEPPALVLLSCGLLALLGLAWKPRPLFFFAAQRRRRIFISK